MAGHSRWLLWLAIGIIVGAVAHDWVIAAIHDIGKAVVKLFTG
jgi:hypothetical protein